MAKLASIGTALVVDDDPDMCWVLAAALAGAGCRATIAHTGCQAVEFLAARAFPLAFVDARLPDMNGIQLATELLGIRPRTRIVMISGYFFDDDVAVIDAIKEAKIHGFLAKPFHIEAVVAALKIDD